MSKKQALTEFHRGCILAAAERLFSEKGTERTTMDDIAREAEYSKATLYVYFQSKVEIVNAILLSGMMLLKKKIHEAIEGQSDWRKAYDAVYRVSVSFYEGNPTAFDAVSGVLRLEEEKDTKGVLEILRVSREIDSVLAAFLERGIEAGFVKTDFTPMAAVLLFWASLAGIVRTSLSRSGHIKELSGLEREAFLEQGSRFLLSAISQK